MATNRVEGDNSDNRIDATFAADPEGEAIDAGNGPGGTNNDVVDGFGGSDTILSGEGGDSVFAGSGSDSVEGGAGDDLLVGDSSDPGAGREVFQWDLAPDPNDGDPIEMGDPISFFVQDTGSVDVTFSVLQATGPVNTTFADNPQNVDGVETGGTPADANSSLAASLPSAGTTDLKLEFSAPVNDVSFQINDLDGTENVQIFAFDGDDNLIPVTLTGGTDVSVLSGEEVIGSGSGTDADAANALSVSIAGPVAQVVVRYTDADGSGDGINLTDVYFNPIGGIVDGGAPGDDTLIGEDGDDTLLGEDGNDVLTGGAGADSIVGGADEDTIVGGTAGDVVDGGSTGVDNDTLDLSSSGPLRVAEETDDPDGNSTSGRIEFIASDGTVSGEMTFAEIENLILPENGAPVTQPDTAVTDEDSSVDIPVLANDTDPEGDPLTVGSATATNGTVTVNADNTLTYTPDADFNGTDTITYTADDGNGNTTPGTVTVTVNPVNDDPVAGDDSGVTEFETPVDLTVLGNDTDVDGDTLGVDSATDGVNGTTTVNADGTITYTPDVGFSGTDTFDYTVSDGNGGTDTATVMVTVGDAPPPPPPLNDDPVAGDDTGTTDFDTPVDLAVLGNDTDPDGDILSVDSATDGTNGSTTVNADGTITYTPDADFSGTDTFDYTVSDGNGGTDTATVTVTVGDAPPPPPVRDGIIDGTDGPDLIDTAYDGDPDGDFVDAGDALLPGAAPDDDSIRAGDGDDTVLAGLGDDEVEGAGGNDSIIGDVGSDTISGGAGSDTIDAGAPLSATPLPDLGFPPDVPADPFPDDDRDFVDGGDGDDVISTGDDADTILGGAGNDLIDAGIDADSVEGGDGTDTIIGGEGSDTINAGEGDDVVYGGLDPAFPDQLNIPDATDPVTNNGQDVINGGSGNDTIFGQDDDDTISGGAGDDFIDGGIDNDSLEGNAGDDTILGGDGDDSVRGLAGEDSIDGGAGDDTLAGGTENDTITGGDGNDNIRGQDGDDVLSGDVGNDTMNGGAGDDAVSGGDGDDLIVGNDGNDTISGGAGADVLAGANDRDVFLDVGAGDTIDGGDGDSTDDGIDDDFDTLDLRGLGRFEIVGETVDPDGDSTSGTVNFLAADDSVTGTLEFSEIENLIPCFTPGTLIATPRGEKLVEDLQLGDRVITRDNGLQEIRWIGHRALGMQDLQNAPHLKPVLIRAGALGHGLPERDMLVSPQHRLLLNSERAALYFEEREVLAAAKHLTGMEGVDQVDASGTTYIHFMFDQHEVVLSNGAWTESFQPGEQVLDGMGAEQRDEIFDLFPELREAQGVKAYQAARRSLKKHEARLLVE